MNKSISLIFCHNESCKSNSIFTYKFSNECFTETSKECFEDKELNMFDFDIDNHHEQRNSPSLTKRYLYNTHKILMKS